MTAQDKDNIRILLVLSAIWLAGAVVDRIWLSLDHNVPSWDQAQYLTGSLNYWRALQHPQWLSNEWWTSFWLLSSKIPPLIYITAGVFQHLFGIGSDQATLIQLLFSAILIGSVYGLGRQLFSAEVGLWAAGLCQLIPGLYRYKIEFLLDYPLAALVTLSFWCLTVWRDAGTTKRSFRARTGWFWVAAFGLSFGLAMMVKQPALLFLFTPVVWVGVGVLRRRQWGRLLQLMVGLCLSVVIFGPWYRTNWLIILTAGKRATIDSAVAKGDAPLNTLKAWTYYWQATPHQVSWLLLLVPIVGLLLYWGQSLSRSGEGGRSKELKYPLLTHLNPQIKSLGWLALFWAGGYLLSSLNINKDDRYVLPYLPAMSVFLAYGLTCWAGRRGRRIRFWTAGLAVMLMFLNLFPVGGVLGSDITQALSPDAQRRPYLGSPWPHRQVIEEIIQTEPYLSSTLGVVPSTGQINQHNFNYYGALQHFQVYGRQVGIRTKQVLQDARSLSWFLTKTGDPGSVRRVTQAAMVQAVERSPDLQLHKAWNLPDGSTLNLYHAKVPLVRVQPFSKSEDLRARSKASSSLPKIRLEQVTVPNRVPPGVPVPVTYQWSGPWQQLQSGLVLLTWHQNSPDSKATPQHRWLHDHGIGMGALCPSKGDSAGRLYLVIEQMAMLPPADTASGSYTLEATYLNRQTGESYPVPVPPTTLSIDPKSSAVPAPELDLVTQLRALAAGLPKGPKAVGPMFEEIGRINQYDPLQDYVIQAQLALQYRLQQEPQNRDWAYGLALTKVLKRQIKGSIAALEHVTQLDAQNPYAYAYLAFVHLYDWQPSAAESALKSAVALNPNLSEVHALIGVKALMQGNLFEAWHALRGLKIRRA